MKNTEKKVNRIRQRMEMTFDPAFKEKLVKKAEEAGMCPSRFIEYMLTREFDKMKDKMGEEKLEEDK